METCQLVEAKMSGFGRVTEKHVAALPGLSGTAVKVLLFCLQKARGRQEVNIVQTELAQLLVRDRSSIHRAMAELRRAGLIEAEGTGWQTRVIFTDGGDAPSATPPDASMQQGGLNGASGVMHGRIAPVAPSASPNSEIHPEKPERADNPPSPQLALSPPPEGMPEGVTRLFALWQTETDHRESRIDEKRQELLERAIRNHGLETCEQAIRGIALSDWHMGRNEKTEGKAYNQLSNVFRSADHTERFAEAWRKHHAAQVAASAPGWDGLTRQWQDLANEFYVLRGAPQEWDREPTAEELARFPFPRPIGAQTVEGTPVLVFEEPELTWFALNVSAAHYARRKLAAAHGDHPDAVGLGKFNLDNTKKDFRAKYDRAARKLSPAPNLR